MIVVVLINIGPRLLSCYVSCNAHGLSIRIGAHLKCLIVGCIRIVLFEYVSLIRSNIIEFDLLAQH